MGRQRRDVLSIWRLEGAPADMVKTSRQRKEDGARGRDGHGAHSGSAV
jgi:hypothetical protein